MYTKVSEKQFPMTSPRSKIKLSEWLAKWMCSLQKHELQDRRGIGQMLLPKVYKNIFSATWQHPSLTMSSVI